MGSDKHTLTVKVERIPITDAADFDPLKLSNLRRHHAECHGGTIAIRSLDAYRSYNVECLSCKELARVNDNVRAALRKVLIAGEAVSLSNVELFPFGSGRKTNVFFQPQSA